MEKIHQNEDIAIPKNCRSLNKYTKFLSRYSKFNLTLPHKVYNDTKKEYIIVMVNLNVKNLKKQWSVVLRHDITRKPVFVPT